MQGVDEAEGSLRGAGSGFRAAFFLGFISGAGGAAAPFGFSSSASAVCAQKQVRDGRGKKCRHAGFYGCDRLGEEGEMSAGLTGSQGVVLTVCIHVYGLPVDRHRRRFRSWQLQANCKHTNKHKCFY